jgi:predicted metalloprotease
MRLEGRRESDNVEDRRDESGGPENNVSGSRVPFGFPAGGTARGGGIGIVGLLVILGVGWLLGVNPLTLLNSMQTGSPGVVDQGEPSQTATQGKVGQPSDEGGKFVAQVLADTEDTWTRIFKSSRANLSTADARAVHWFDVVGLRLCPIRRRAVLLPEGREAVH